MINTDYIHSLPTCTIFLNRVREQFDSTQNVATDEIFIVNVI